MAQSLYLRCDPVRSLAYSSIGATYTAIGTMITVIGPRIYFIQNLTNATLMFSYDGVNDHFPLPANGFRLLDICTNQIDTQGFFLSAGTQFYVKEIGTPTSGSVYLTVEYAKSV